MGDIGKSAPPILELDVLSEEVRMSFGSFEGLSRLIRVRELGIFAQALFGLEFLILGV